MQNGKFLCFMNLSAEQYTRFKDSISPETETSLFKQVPLSALEEVKNMVKNMLPGRQIRVRYRGPRYDAMRLTCQKRHARSVAIYVD